MRYKRDSLGWNPIWKICLRSAMCGGKSTSFGFLFYFYKGHILSYIYIYLYSDWYTYVNIYIYVHYMCISFNMGSYIHHRAIISIHLGEIFGVITAKSGLKLLKMMCLGSPILLVNVNWGNLRDMTNVFLVVIYHPLQIHRIGKVALLR